jgi:multidrug transporter EmrE-like cation transporter
MTGCCVLIAVASIRIHTALQGVPIAIAVAVVGFAGTVALGMCGFALGWPALSVRQLAFEALRCAVFDLPLMGLTLWLAREIAPIRLSARFLLTPLVTVLEGYAFVRGPMELSRIAALVLIAAGAAMLLLRSERDESEELPALHLR